MQYLSCLNQPINSGWNHHKIINITIITIPLSTLNRDHKLHYPLNRCIGSMYVFYLEGRWFYVRKVSIAVSIKSFGLWKLANGTGYMHGFHTRPWEHTQLQSLYTDNYRSSACYYLVRGLVKIWVLDQNELYQMKIKQTTRGLSSQQSIHTIYQRNKFTT